MSSVPTMPGVPALGKGTWPVSGNDERRTLNVELRSDPGPKTRPDRWWPRQTRERLDLFCFGVRRSTFNVLSRSLLHCSPGATEESHP